MKAPVQKEACLNKMGNYLASELHKGIFLLFYSGELLFIFPGFTFC